MVKERRIALAALTAGTALALSWAPALATQNSIVARSEVRQTN